MAQYRKVGHRHMFAQLEVDLDVLAARIFFPKPSTWLSNAAIQQWREFNFPNRSLKKKPTPLDSGRNLRLQSLCCYDQLRLPRRMRQPFLSSTQCGTPSSWTINGSMHGTNLWPLHVQPRAQPNRCSSASIF